MKKIFILFIFTVLLSPIHAYSEISTSDLAARAQEGTRLFQVEKAERDRRLEAILQDTSIDETVRQNKIKSLQNDFLKKSREIHINYREPFVRRVISETNSNLPPNTRIEQGKGSDIYLRNRVTGNVLKDARGRKILNPKHRGMQGDLDISGNPTAAKRLRENFGKYGIDVTSSDLNAPGAKDFDDVNVTVNVKGINDPPGSSAHETQVAMDAFSSETYVSMSMEENQPGKALVETNDHAKKAAKGLSRPAEALLGAGGEDLLQNMSKGTLKSIDSGKISDTQLKEILQKSGYQGDVKTFKKQISDLKTGHLAQGVGLNSNNVESFQKACKASVKQAVSNASEQAEIEISSLENKIKKTEEKLKSGQLNSQEAEALKKDINVMRNELTDSKVKIKQTNIAAKAKIEGKTYEAIRPVEGKVTVLPDKPELSRMDAVKKGLKPGLLEIAGYGASAYNIYENLSGMQKGKISRNDAVIGITSEVVDTGFGMAGDVGTAAAVGSIGTGTAGTVATAAAPVIITAAAGYAVKESVKEGLDTYKAFKVEEINKRIARAKTQEAVNKMQLKAENLLRQGNATGDWRYFSQAEQIADRLNRMYRVTGDTAFLNTEIALTQKIDSQKKSLENKYKTSIYNIKSQLAKNSKGQDSITGKQVSNETVQQVTAPAGHPLKPGIINFLNTIKAECKNIENSENIREWDRLDAEVKDLRNRIKTAQQNDDRDKVGALYPKYIQLREQYVALYNTPEMVRYNSISKLSRDLAEVMNKAEWDNANQMILNSGYAAEFGYK